MKQVRQFDIEQVSVLNSSLCLSLNQEACALLLEESLHYIQAKFLCSSADQAAKAFHINFAPFEIYPSSSPSSSSHTAPFTVHRLGLVIDGRTLAYALDKSLEDKFLAVARSCRSVLCCRSTPLQKSMVVKLVRNKLKVMTLAIGKPQINYISEQHNSLEVKSSLILGGYSELNLG